MTAGSRETADARIEAFAAALAALPEGYGEGFHAGRRYGVTVSASADGRRRRIFGEELGGTERISGNLYALGDGRLLLKPCEMPAEKVIGFVLEFQLETAPRRERSQATTR